MPVGNSDGDAIIVRYEQEGGFWLQIVDGGYTDVGEAMIEHIERYHGRDVIIADMVVSHADNDHAKGLIPVFRKFRVANLWMNRPWLYANDVMQHFHGNWLPQNWIREVRDCHEYLVELEQLAHHRNMEPREVFQGAVIGPSLVLAPSRQRYIDLIPDLGKTPPPYRSELARETAGGGVRAALSRLSESMGIETLAVNPPATSASNETSVVQLLRYDSRSILLTADAGPESLMEAARYAHSRGILAPPDMVQIPHHGSRRNVSPAVLNAWLGKPNGGALQRGNALVMVGRNKSDHPRKKVKNAFIRRGYPVFVSRSDSGSMFMLYGYESRGLAISPEPFSHDVEDD